MVLFDLPGTMGSDGVIAAISALDYLFVPIKADRLVLESTLNFATTINDRLIKTGLSSLKKAVSVLEHGGSKRTHYIV